MRLFRLLALVGVLTADGSFAQAIDYAPESNLRALISAFQNCGPPITYQMLSPTVFTAVAQQTGGSGCYPAIAQAGPVESTRIIEKKDFPVGPLYVIRVTHKAGPVDWFIGYNNSTGKIEYLTFQSVVGNETPSIKKGPRDTPPATDESESGPCRKFPAMCPKK